MFEKSWMAPGPVGLFRYLMPAKPAAGMKGAAKSVGSKVQAASPSNTST